MDKLAAHGPLCMAQQRMHADSPFVSLAFVHAAHAQINVAMPINPSWPVSLTSEAMFEVRTTRAFKVRFTKIGLDTYVQVAWLAVAL